MDWIYRNVRGARVTRRTHQILEVPELPDQEVFQTLVPLHIQEREGGYGDRSGNKAQRYIQWLLDDLTDYPNDTRTLYYIAYAYFDKFTAGGTSPSDIQRKSQEQWNDLSTSIEWFNKRIAITNEGNKEEHWFAVLKVAEIYERYYNDWHKAEQMYKQCIDSDNERADPYFYIGQHYRLIQDYNNAIPWLIKASTLKLPQRSLFQWEYLYNCLSKIELARAVVGLSDKASINQLRTARKVLKQAKCELHDHKLNDERKQLFKMLSDVLKAKKQQKDEPVNENSNDANNEQQSNAKDKQQDTSTQHEQQTTTTTTTITEPSTIDTNSISLIDRLLTLITDKHVKSIKSILTDYDLNNNNNLLSSLRIAIESVQMYSDALHNNEKYNKCIHYNQQTQLYKHFIQSNHDILQQLFNNKKYYKTWNNINQQITSTCQSESETE